MGVREVKVNELIREVEAIVVLSDFRPQRNFGRRLCLELRRNFDLSCRIKNSHMLTATHNTHYPFSISPTIVDCGLHDISQYPYESPRGNQNKRQNQGRVRFISFLFRP